MRDQQSLRPLEYSMSVKLLTEHHLAFLSLTGGGKCLSESTLVKVTHCWKSYAAAHMDVILSADLPPSSPASLAGFSRGGPTVNRFITI